MMMDINNNNIDDEDYIRDLTLAAELGKTLLERNQDLQTNIITLEQIIIEKNREIQLLEKHLHDNKELLSSKLRHLEQIDYQNNELEKQILFYKNCLDKEKLKSKELNDSINELSVQYENLDKEYRNVLHENQQLHLFKQQQLQDKILNVSNINKNYKTNNKNIQRKFSNEQLTPNKNQIKRFKSETNLIALQSNNVDSNNQQKEVEEQLDEVESNENDLSTTFDKLNTNEHNLNVIFQKWLIFFQSYSHKKLIEYKTNTLRSNDENVKLKEDLHNKDAILNKLKKSHTILTIDLEEYQKLNNDLEKKLIKYENLFDRFKLNSLIEHHEEQLQQQEQILNSMEMIEIDTNNNLNERQLRRSSSRNKLSSLLAAAKISDNSFDAIHLLNDLNLKSNNTLDKEFESFRLNNKKDAQTQYDFNSLDDNIEANYELVPSNSENSDININDNHNHNNNNNNNVYSSYKDIFRKIYDTLNTSKTI